MTKPAAASKVARALAIQLNRPDLARKYAAAYLRLDPTDVNAPSIRLAALMLDPASADAKRLLSEIK